MKHKPVFAKDTWKGPAARPYVSGKAGTPERADATVREELDAFRKWAAAQAQNNSTDYGTNPEPVTLEQALANAVLWAEKAAQAALDRPNLELASDIGSGILCLREALAVVQREGKTP